MAPIVIGATALGVWLAVVLLPWRPHRMSERLEPAAAPADVSRVTVLIPARNEAEHIEGTLRALARQGPGLKVVVIDDESTDGTAHVCRAAARGLAAPRPDGEGEYAVEISCLSGRPLPDGWGGKLWALEQGLAQSSRAYTLLLDADIELADRMIPALLAQAAERSAALVSIMARLRCDTSWEKLLVPAFVFFFKLLYPFALVNRAESRVAAAAGGCMLVETAALTRAGAFSCIRGELIDDCSLARKIKDGGGGLWLGVGTGVRSRRRYATVQPFWRMVSRTAYTQLKHSPLLLLLTTLAMLIMFMAPIVLLVSAPAAASAFAAGALGLMLTAFLPTVRFYGLSVLWALSLPAAAGLFLAMTWSSAAAYWRGTRAVWKGRVYDAAAD